MSTDLLIPRSRGDTVKKVSSDFESPSFAYGYKVKCTPNPCVGGCLRVQQLDEDLQILKQML